MSTAPSKREFDIDFFRGWVCLSLTVLHFYHSALFDSFTNLFGKMGQDAVLNIRLGVESFFVLAGFMMAHMMRPMPGENVSIAGYLKRRFYRLIIPYWTAVLIYAAYRGGIYVLFHRGDGPLTVGDVLKQLFLVQEFYYKSPAEMEKVSPIGYWSMVTLEQFYLIWLGFYAICIGIFGRNNGKGYARAERAMAFLTFSACIGSLSLWNMGLEHEMQWQLPLWGTFLTLGMLLYWAIRHNFSSLYFWLVLPAILATGIYSDTYKMYKALITVAIFIPLARGARLPDNVVIRFLAFCGKRSYSIYLIHSIAGIAFISMTWKLTAKSDWLAFPILIGAVIVSILASMVFFRYVEVPCQSKARTVEYRRKSPADEAAGKALEREPLPVS